MVATLANMCVVLFAELAGVGALTLALYVYWNKMTA